MRLAIQLPVSEQAAENARNLIRERLADKLPAVVLYDLLTVVTELVANAVHHGEGDVVGLAIEVADDGMVGGEVQSSGGGRVEPRTMDLTQDRGLGLHIVDAITKWWRAEGDGVIRVTFELQPV